MENRIQAKPIQFAFEKKLLFFFTLAFIALLSILIVFYRHAQKVKSSRQLLDNTHQLLNKIYAVQIGIENIETNARGFYLTGNNTFLEPLSKSISLLNTNLEQLTALSRNDYERVKIDSLKSLISKKVVYINNNLEIRKEKGLDEIGKVVASGVGQSYSIDIKNRVDKLDNELHSQIDKCNLEDENNMQVTKLMFGVLLLFIIVILIAVGFIIVRNQKARSNFEEELSKSKELFSKLFNGNPAAMALSRLDDGKILNVNDSMVEILGFKDKNELIGKSSKELYLLAQPEQREDAVKKIQNDEIVKNIEMVACKTNGDQIWFSTTAVYIEIDSVPCLFSVSLDITEQKKAEENLKQSLKEIIDYKFALDESSIIAITDIKGKIQFINNKFCEISKFSKEEIIGNDHRIINSGYHPKEFFANLYSTIAKGKIWRGDVKNKAKDGSLYWVDTTIVPFLNEQGKPRKYVAIRVDITARKNAEMKLSELNKELESFSYTVSHDLHAPLRSINGYANILTEKYAANLDDTAKHYLDIIQSNSKKMSKLIKDLLSFSRLEKKELMTSKIDMNELIASVINEEIIAETNKFNYTVSNLLPAQGDPVLIKQVWINLISNAIKYSKYKTISNIEIGSSYENTNVIYYIKDNGEGFDMNHYDKLFKVFNRLHPASSFDGTGIGLASAQKIITRHNGNIWAESTLNEGACFYFSLPGLN